MIKENFPDAVIKKAFTPAGISNVIQTVEDLDILFVRAKSQDQLDSLIKINLKATFEGLVVSPFVPSDSRLNYCTLKSDEIQIIEDRLIDHFYPVRKENTSYIGITGTNGKTSTCWYLMELGRLSGLNVLYMGTIGVFLGGTKLKDKILTTTPSLLSLRKLHNKYKEEVDVIALEVSSHALEQERLRGIRLDSCGWTNFSQDHLDFHNSMQEYFAAKSKLVTYSKSNEIIVPTSEYGLVEQLGKNTKVRKTISLESFCTSFPESLGKGFSRLNIEMAATCLQAIGLLKDGLNLETLSPPPGRFQEIKKPSALFIVDYAHTPDAIEKVLEQIREVHGEKKVVTVFGCGGDRDKSKRPLMLVAAMKNSDKVIVTSDNPRTENPEAILEDIVVNTSGVAKEVDRTKAIAMAYEYAKKSKDKYEYIILVAGKGDENYQEVDGVRYNFSDIRVIEEI